MTIAVGGNIGATLAMRDGLLDTQTIMTSDLKYPVAVSIWNDQKALRYSATDTSGLLGTPVKVKVVYPISNLGNAFVQDPNYLITDLAGNPISGYTINVQTGDILLNGTRVGLMKFRDRDAGILTEHISEINNLNSVIDDLTNVVSMFQKEETAMLNSGAIS